MSPRPRKVSDDEIFAATHRAMSRVGPGELTLALIADEAGVTAGALVQRFGSKRALLLALATLAAESAGALIGALRAQHRSPVAALRAYADCMAGLAPSGDALARNLAYLQLDVADPDFRAQLVTQYRATRAGLETLVAEAIAGGELAPGTPARKLARTLEAVISGALFTWGIHREGTARRWIRDHFDTVLAPYLVR